MTESRNAHRRDYIKGGGAEAEGALVPPEFGCSEKRTERETDNLLLIAPLESESQRSPCIVI